MKFYISSTNCGDDASLLRKEYPCLYDFGYGEDIVKYDSRSRIKDESGNIIVQITKNGITKVKPYINIDDLEDLIQFRIACGKELIFTYVLTSDPGYCLIEIYDGYRE